jgi:hypothetical protein
MEERANDFILLEKVGETEINTACCKLNSRLRKVPVQSTANVLWFDTPSM